MKVEIVQSDNISELDKFINACIENRKVEDIKITTTVFEEKIFYTALVMINTLERKYV